MGLASARRQLSAPRLESSNAPQAEDGTDALAPQETHLHNSSGSDQAELGPRPRLHGGEHLDFGDSDAGHTTPSTSVDALRDLIHVAHRAMVVLEAER